MLALGTAVAGTPMALASGGSGGHSGSGGGEARVINKVETEVEDGVLQVHERREIRNADGSRVRVDVTHEIEDGIPVVTVRERTRDAFGNQTDVRTRTPEGIVSSILPSGAVLAAAEIVEPRVEVKIEKDLPGALEGDELKIEIKKEAEAVRVDEGFLTRLHEMLVQLFDHLHIAM